MKKLAVDVDGVLFNFMESFDKASEIVLKRPIIVHKDELQQDFYHLGRRVGTDEKTVMKILDYMLESGMYSELEPLPGAKEGLQKIRDAGFEISIVTALPEMARDMRLFNLKNKLDFEPDNAFFVGMGMSKREALLKLSPDVFIDDRIDYLVSAPSIYHLVWCDQREEQSDKESLVDVHVHSLKEWTDNHLHKVSTALDDHYYNGKSLQLSLKLENHRRKYSI